MTPEFLRDIQRHGWVVESANATDCVVKCPSEGCGMRARLRAGKAIPPRLNGAVRVVEAATSFDAIRETLRRRRQDLCLTITEVEEAAGMTNAHLAKFERQDYSRIPNLETLILWAGALGYEITLRAAGLPSMTLRTISDTRPFVARRQRRHALPQQQPAKDRPQLG